MVVLAIVGRELISIHASLTGGDGFGGLKSRKGLISIHASLTGGDAQAGVAGQQTGQFQSTPPSREATHGTQSRIRL